MLQRELQRFLHRCSVIGRLAPLDDRHVHHAYPRVAQLPPGLGALARVTLRAGVIVPCVVIPVDDIGLRNIKLPSKTRQAGINGLLDRFPSDLLRLSKTAL